MKKEIIIISVGGSLIIQDSINTNFLEKLVFFIRREVKNGKRFILVTGGGKTARKYQEGVKHFTDDSLDSDWIGIHSTILNANLVKIILKDIAYDKIAQNPYEKYNWGTGVLIASGYEPGCSTDFDAVELANTYEVKKIINLSNIDYAYDSDPRVNPDAKVLKNINWDDFLKFLPEKWSPGLSSPFDPIASKLAKEKNIQVAIINGEHLDRVNDYLDGKEFIGTLIN